MPTVCRREHRSLPKDTQLASSESRSWTQTAYGWPLVDFLPQGRRHSLAEPPVGNCPKSLMLQALAWTLEPCPGVWWVGWRDSGVSQASALASAQSRTRGLGFSSQPGRALVPSSLFHVGFRGLQHLLPAEQGRGSLFPWTPSITRAPGPEQVPAGTKEQAAGFRVGLSTRTPCSELTGVLAPSDLFITLHRGPGML